MDAVNRTATSIFDVVLSPFELLGTELSLILVSGVFGILALILFKHISWQKGIKATKDKIKGHMIAIRIYQDDLVIVGKSVTKVVLRNFQYLALNFGPILPLFIPFMLVAAQLVVRYAFDPVPVATEEVRLPGAGTMLEIDMKKGQEARVAGLTLTYPEGLRPVSALARSPLDGRAFQEFVATHPGEWEIRIEMDGTPVGTKTVVAGDRQARVMQPERVSGFWAAWLWPAEDTFPADCAVGRVSFRYPDRDLTFLPGGPFGILLTFFVSSILFGLLILRPLGIQI